MASWIRLIPFLPRCGFKKRESCRVVDGSFNPEEQQAKQGQTLCFLTGLFLGWTNQPSCILSEGSAGLSGCLKPPQFPIPPLSSSASPLRLITLFADFFETHISSFSNLPIFGSSAYYSKHIAAQMLPGSTIQSQGNGLNQKCILSLVSCCNKTQLPELISGKTHLIFDRVHCHGASVGHFLSQFRI